MKLEKLKPCPFCGGEPEIILRGNEHTKSRSAEIKCKGCRSMSPVVAARRYGLDFCEQKVTEAWNRRSVGNQLDGMIDSIIKRLFRKDSEPYIYGTLNGMKARFHKKTKVLEFVLWNKGHGGRSEDYWHQAGYGHEANFIRDAL